MGPGLSRADDVSSRLPRAGYRVIGQGASATVLKLGNDRVLKLFAPDLAPILLEREQHFTQLAHDHGIPTPRPLGAMTHEGRDGIVFEYFEGQNLDTYTRPRVWAHRRRRWVRGYSLPRRSAWEPWRRAAHATMWRSSSTSCRALRTEVLIETDIFGGNFE